MNTIKQIFEKKIDDALHQRFIRFGKGEFERFLITIKKGKNLKIKTSYDFANDLVGLIAENIDEDAAVKGSILANKDCQSELNFEIEDFKKKGKLFIATINTTLTKEQLRNLYEKFNSNFLLLNIDSIKFKLKCGKSLPKPGKKLKDDFCSATLPLTLLDEFAFDFSHDFNEAKIVHRIVIDEIIVPEEYKNDFEKARLMAKRKGTLTREIAFNGAEKKNSVGFEI